jgi:hypothetical protein
VEVLGFAAGTATDGEAGLEGLKGAATGSEPARDSVLGPTGAESLDVDAGVGGVDEGADAGCGGVRQA